MLPGILLAALAALQLLQQRPLERSAVFPPDTRIPVRFARTITGGRDPAGELIEVQTMAPMEAGGCVVVPAFTPIMGTVAASRPGRSFRRRGYLELRFDSLLVAPGSRRAAHDTSDAPPALSRTETSASAPGAWVPMAGVIDSLEWASRGPWSARGGIERGGHSIRGIVGTAGLAGLASAATGLGVIPVVAVTGLDLFIRGPRAQVFAGQRGVVRLAAPLVIRMPERCRRAEPRAADTEPVVPPLAPRAMNRQGTAGADPINLVLRGTRADIDSAMSRAGWLPARRSTFGALAREAEAVLLSQRDSMAPMSHEYYQGRVEDLRFERASPTARARHHVRLWQADSAGTLWAAAATEDIGMLVSARARTVTHRVAPEIDDERELLVSELLAGGCAVLEGYVTLPGAVTSGAGVAGQKFVTDARAAVVQVVACPRYALPL